MPVIRPTWNWKNALGQVIRNIVDMEMSTFPTERTVHDLPLIGMGFFRKNPISIINIKIITKSRPENPTKTHLKKKIYPILEKSLSPCLFL
jgi:hypothetical protein